MTSKPTILVIDSETTGLDVADHALWEIGVVELTQTEGLWDVGVTTSWQVELTPQQIAEATPKALEVNRFSERYDLSKTVSVEESAKMLHGLTHGQVLACNVPTFDIPFLTAHVQAGGYSPEWKHRVIDIRSAVLGALSTAGVVATAASLAALVHGLVPAQESDTLHTAAGDALWSAGVLADVLAGTLATEVQVRVPSAWEGTD